jgi:tRNA (guanosine-2'-O-)-methyltransferase
LYFHAEKSICKTPERVKRLLTVLDQRQPDLTVVMENVSDPHNISAVMRTCDAVGVQDVYILNSSIAPHRKWGKKSSSSAAGWLTIHEFTDTGACFEELRKHYDRIYTTLLTDDSVPLYGMNLTGPVALVFGNEKDGVSQEAAALADGNFIIPQTGLIRSLNISVACAVTLYEAYRQKSLAGHYASRRMSGGRLTALLQQWELPAG